MDKETGGPKERQTGGLTHRQTDEQNYRKTGMCTKIEAEAQNRQNFIII